MLQSNLLFQPVHVNHQNSIMWFVLFKYLVYNETCQSLCPSHHGPPLTVQSHLVNPWLWSSWQMQLHCASLQVFVFIHCLIHQQCCACGSRQIRFRSPLNCLCEFPSKCLKMEAPCVEIYMISCEDQ